MKDKLISLQFFRDIKLGHKLFITYLVIAVIPLIFWNVSFYMNANYRISEQAKNHFSSTFDSKWYDLHSKISKLQEALKIVTANQMVAHITTAKNFGAFELYNSIVFQLDPVLESAITYNPSVKEILIYTDGDIKNSRKEFIPLSSFDDAQLLSVLQKQVDPVWRMKDGNLQLLQRVILWRDFTQFAIIGLTVDPHEIFKNNMSGEQNIFDLCVESKDGEIIYKETNIPSSVNEDKKIYLSRAFESNGLNLVMAMSPGTYLISSKNIFTSISISTIISLILIVFATNFFTRIIVSRIDKLNKNLSMVVQSKFTTEIFSNDKDEIGEITNSVGLMVKETKHLIEKVYESKIQQRESEIKALQAQINPHFLYNTLSAINWQALKSGNQDISKIVIAMSTFYRTVLNKGNNITSVQNELKNTKAYLEIQLTVLKNSFDVVYDIDTGIAEYDMPNLILQPVVENAIEHGISLKTKGRGLITIRAREENHDILFEILDNGIGISNDTLNEIFANSKRRGYGIKNVNERLRLFFGEGYGITFNSEVGIGTTAIIRIPKYIHFE